MARSGRLDIAARGTGAASVAALLALLLVGGAHPAAAGGPPGARVASHGSRAAKTIALTFDDGASPANCRRILAELVTADVPATFFPISAAIRLDPAFWQLVAEAGYPIGDHTVSHPHMPRLGYAAQLRQMTESRATIKSAIGRPMLDVFRPPYGEYDAVTGAAAAAAGFRTLLLWDTSDRDTSPRGTVAEMQAAAEQGTNGSVVLLHCGPNATPYLLPNVIAFYRSHGFRFVTIPELLGVSWRAGSTGPVTADEILAGLAPLPPSSKGGTLIDIDGRIEVVAPGTQESPAPSASAGASRAPRLTAEPPVVPNAVLPAPSENTAVVPAHVSAGDERVSVLAAAALGAVVVVLGATLVVRRGPR
ncbi:MAG: polysaccharide deacetylase family protein [Chloroflexota bacterium]